MMYNIIRLLLTKPYILDNLSLRKKNFFFYKKFHVLGVLTILFVYSIFILSWFSLFFTQSEVNILTIIKFFLVCFCFSTLVILLFFPKFYKPISYISTHYHSNSLYNQVFIDPSLILSFVMACLFLFVLDMILLLFHIFSIITIPLYDNNFVFFLYWYILKYVLYGSLVFVYIFFFYKKKPQAKLYNPMDNNL